MSASGADKKRVKKEEEEAEATRREALKEEGRLPRANVKSQTKPRRNKND